MRTDMSFKKILKALLPAVVILAAAGGLASWMFKNKIEAESKEPIESVTRVQFVEVSTQSYKVVLATTGEVRPRTQTTLIPQVAGEILEVSPNFRNGGFFKAEEVLLVLDDRDYVAAETEASATLAQAEATYKLEQARSQQALASWKDLGRGGEPSELAMRKPQLAQAKAESEAASARLARARRDLARTKITAPYAGYVRQNLVDLGQFVTMGTPLGEIFAIDYVEVRLSLDPSDLKFIDLPESYRSAETAEKFQAKVELRDSNIPDAMWEGTIIRAEGEFDARSRKLFVIAQVDDPYSLNEVGRPPLKVGQFVKAEIVGKELQDVFVIPERAVRFGKEIKVIDENNKISFREVTVVWSDLPDLVVRDGLVDGDRICLTTLPFAVEGTSVDPMEFIPETEALDQVNPAEDATAKTEEDESS